MRTGSKQDHQQPSTSLNADLHVLASRAGPTGSPKRRDAVPPNQRQAEPPATAEQGYHLTEDLADRAVGWHVPKEWADRYAGAFDNGWDALRERTFARQKELGVIPADAELTVRHDEIPAWDDMPEELKPVLARQMEVYTGFLEHTDHHVGRLIGALEDLEVLGDTIVHTSSATSALPPRAP